SFDVMLKPQKPGPGWPPPKWRWPALIEGVISGRCARWSAPRQSMRPPVLNPLFAPITTLAGIGSKVERLYRRLLGRDETPRIIDLVFHLPTGTIDRRGPPQLQDRVPRGVVDVNLTVARPPPAPPRRARAPHLLYATAHPPA